MVLSPVLRIFLPALLAVICSGCQNQRNSNRPDSPNIVVFIADDVSSADLGAYGNSYAHTPNIDKLAAKGLKCNRAFLTTSSCSPSRASIISGRYPHNTGAPELHMPLPDGMPTLAGILKAAGYFTGASGKWHLGKNARKDFDQVMDSAIGPGGEDRWLELLKQVPDSQPFFLWMASLDAHRPWDMDRMPPASPTTIPVPPYLVPDSATREDLGQYYREIHRFDTHVGTVVETLEKQGMLRNTILIVLADNGRPFPRDKTRMYDSGLQTPLIVYWEKARALSGAQSDALISAIDLAPTLLDLVGLPPAASFQGISFSQLLRDPGSEHRRYVFGEHNWHDFAAYERMVRSDSFLLIQNRLPEKPMSSAADVHSGPSFRSLRDQKQAGTLSSSLYDIHFKAPRPEFELYQVLTDPHQLNNLAGNPAYAGPMKRLSEKLLKWKTHTGDGFPSPLTPDHYEFETAAPLFPDKAYNDVARGRIPGKSEGASKILVSDSVLQK